MKPNGEENNTSWFMYVKGLNIYLFLSHGNVIRVSICNVDFLTIQDKAGGYPVQILKNKIHSQC